MAQSPQSRRAFLLSTLALSAVPFLPARRAGAQTADLSSAEAALRRSVRAAVARDPTLAATLVRLSFHDAFTTALSGPSAGGANGSIRLELDRGENFGLARAVDALAPLVARSALGWGDAVAVAGAAAVEAAGGPSIPLRLGRPSVDRPDPTGQLPAPSLTVPELRAMFGPRGLDDRDLVALSGAHTLGRVGGGGPFVAQPNTFLNDYFLNLMWFQKRRDQGLSTKTGPPDTPNFQLPSDIQLLDDARTRAVVEEFANSQDAFFKQFVASFQKMTDLGFASS